MRKILGLRRRDRAVRRARRRGGAGGQRGGGGQAQPSPRTSGSRRPSPRRSRSSRPGTRTIRASRSTIVPVDVNSVHDKLLTNFVGGTAADVIHDEAADIAGLHAAGLPGEPHAAAHRSSSRRRSRRRSGTRSTSAASGSPACRPDADVQRLREHGHPQGGGHQGADREESVDVDAVPRDREAAHDERPLRRLLGPSLADGGDPDDGAQLRRAVLLPRERQVELPATGPPSRPSSSRCTT